MSELWRPVVGYDGWYIVSNRGRVKRIKPCRGAIVGRIVLPKRTKKGYHYISLSKGDFKKRFLLHRLVIAAFLPAVPGKEDVNHKDGCKTNNHLSNLEWSDKASNNAHAIRNGLMPFAKRKGEQNGRAKLTAEQVKEIRRLRGKERQIDLAARFGVAKSTIWWIQSGRHWQSV